MAAQYEADLERATEVVLTRRNRVRRTDARPAGEGGEGRARRAVSGSAGRAAAGAVSVGSALGAALTNRRTLGPAEVSLLGTMSVITLAIALAAHMGAAPARLSDRRARGVVRHRLGLQGVGAMAARTTHRWRAAAAGHPAG